MMDGQCFSSRCFINTIINKPKISYTEQRDSSLTDTETCQFYSALLVEIMIHTCSYVSNHWGESLHAEQKFKNNFIKYYALTDTKLDMTLKYIFFNWPTTYGRIQCCKYWYDNCQHSYHITPWRWNIKSVSCKSDSTTNLFSNLLLVIPKLCKLFQAKGTSNYEQLTTYLKKT